MCFTCLITIAFLIANKTIADDGTIVVPVGQRQLLLDDHGVQKIERLKRTMHRPRKMGAVIRSRYFNGKENTIQTRCAPQWDAERGVYRIWLITAECYESRDGLHWTPTEKRPNMAVMSAVIDPDDPDPNRRYKGLVIRGGNREPVVSTDGITWTKLKVPPIPSQDESNLSYDRIDKTFIATVKHGGPYGRTVWLSTSKDFQSWTKPELIFHPDEKDQELAKKVIAERVANPAMQKMFNVDPKDYNVQVYNMGVFRYEGMYIGIPAMFHSTGKVPNYPNTDGFHVFQLTCSRDLRKWTRLGNRAIWIGHSPANSGAYDLTQMIPPSTAIVRDNELWFYYTGLKYRGTFNYIGKYPNGRIEIKPGLDPDRGAICLATLRRDGFVSLDSTDMTGYVLTKPFQCPAGQLYVNAHTQNGGRVLVEVLDRKNEVIATSEPLEGDQVAGEIQWSEDSTPKLSGKIIRLKITHFNGRLYSYWFDADRSN